MKHTKYECPEDCEGCQFCLGGLFMCTVCRGGEGSLPTECPGVKMFPHQETAVYDGLLDFKNGGWVTFGLMSKLN